MNKQNFEVLETERVNPETEDIDKLNTYEILKKINEEDKKVALAVSKVLDKISIVVDYCVDSIKSGGRVIYAGAGTSGRIGFIDAVEVVPTFGVSKDLFIPLIAGGDEALKSSIEEVEDMPELGRNDAMKVKVNSKDVVIGITASGRTPYVRGVLEYAKQQGSKTALICNVSNPLLKDFADVVISILTGPEVISGSTRMKAGTSQKMVLNMISTTTMIKLGKVYKNYLVDVLVLNEKLRERAIRIIIQTTGVDYETAAHYLKESDNKTKLAILMILSGKEREECEKVLEKFWNLKDALEYLKNINGGDGKNGK